MIFFQFYHFYQYLVSSSSSSSSSPFKCVIFSECQYSRGKWSKCHPTTYMKSRLMTLTQGDSAVCNTTKVVTRRCKRQRKQRKRQKGQTTSKH